MTTRRRPATRRRRALSLVACLTLLGAATPFAAVARQDNAPPAPDAAWLDAAVARTDRAALDALLGKPLPEPPADARWLGEAQTLVALRGKVVVLQLWSRTNRISDRALAEMAALAKERPDDLVVIAAHPKQGGEGVEAFLSRRDTPFHVMIDESGAFFEALGLAPRPANIVVDKTGVVRYAGLNAAGVRAAVDALAAIPDAPPTAAKPPVKRTPAASYPPIDGEITGARDLRGKRAPAIDVQQWLTAPAQPSGKVVVVDFWATWCGPCVRMIPHMNDLAAAFPNDLAVVGVSNEDAETVRRFMKRTEMNYPVAVDQQARMMRAVEVRSIPHVMVVSPDGVVRWQGHPGRLTKQLVQQIIDAGKPSI